MSKRLTNAEYIAEWDLWRLHDWYAVDQKDAETGAELRLYVTPIRADAVLYASRKATGYGLVDYLGEPCEPGEFGAYPFFRMTIIDSEKALEFMEGDENA